MAKFYQIDHQDIFHPSVARYIRCISINSRFQPTPRGIFGVKTLYAILVLCDKIPDPPLFRAIFLSSFYAFLRMSNVAPHSRSQFDPSKHFLCQNLIFGHPGAHLVIKWTKTLQDDKSHHMVKLPEIDNLYLCPVKAFKALLSTRQLPPTAPLFATNTPLFHQIIDTQVRQALKTVLTSRNINHVGHGFHTFRRSGGHGGRVVTLSPPTSEAGVLSP